MKGYLTVKETAERFNCSPRWISKLCQDGRISGLEVVGKTYLIPEDAVMPTDRRITTGQYKAWRDKYGKNKKVGI